MNKSENQSPSGAPLVDCEHDHECTILTCDYCLRELPANSAMSDEGADYVAHFCGLNCLEAWRKRGRGRGLQDGEA